jgi:hypothetical protein
MSTNASINVNEITNQITKEKEVEIILTLRCKIEEISADMATFSIKIAEAMNNLINQK